MKKSLFLLAILAFSFQSFAVTTPGKSKAPKATEVFLPIGKNGELVSLYDLSQMKTRELQRVTGQKMGFFKRIGFKMAQNKLRNSINADGSFSQARAKKYYKRMIDGSTGFHLGGFALGFFLGLIGVIIAYVIKDSKKRNRVKWAWIGLAIWLVLYLGLIL